MINYNLLRFCHFITVLITLIKEIMRELGWLILSIRQDLESPTRQTSSEGVSRLG